nr:polysaccharide deacetylase family protein [Micrococcus luteus]
MRLSELRVRVGQPRVKGGAVAIIADHGSVQFRQYMLPHLRAHRLRCSLAMIGTRLDPAFKWYDTEAGVTWDEVAGWATTDGLEITNHSLTHGDASTADGVRSEIVGGLDALRAALPGIPIDTWSQVGVSATGYAGFGTGQVLSSYWETTAGRLILDHHTLATGSAPVASAYGPNIFPLDGHPKLGVNGRWIDTGVTTSVTQMIDTAVAQHMGCIVRIHPQFIGQPGYITADALAAFLASLAARRDAGELDVLTFRELNLAVRT